MKKSEIAAAIAREYETLHPYAATAREVMQKSGLAREQELQALRAIAREAPWFSPVVYMRACHAAGQVLSVRAA